MIEPKGCPMPGGCACPDPTPPPEEIARLAATLRSMWRKHDEDDQVFGKAADALERMAQEIERLKAGPVLWTFRIGDLRISHGTPGMVHIDREGESGHFSESEFVEAVRNFVSERL